LRGHEVGQGALPRRVNRQVALAAPEPTPCAQLRLLGAFRVSTTVGDVVLPGSAQRVLAFLAVHQKWVPRPLVAGSLWPNTTDQRAAACLRSAIWRLRPHRVALVETAVARIRLAPSVDVDLNRFTRIAHDLEGGTPIDDVRDLPDGFEEELLPDSYEDWVVVWRERWRQLRLRALEQLAAIYSGAGSYGLAIRAGRAAVQTEPLRESAHRSLIRAHLAEGNREEAIRQYRCYRRLLWEELGLEPSAIMGRLVGPLMPN
jgi:DNA-binding SARP family transcriptional activator